MTERTVLLTTAKRPHGPQRPTARLLPAAISATGERMFLYFSAIGNALVSMHDIDPALANAMKVRLSAFQRQGFPLSERLKVKANIGLDDSLKLVFAFELLEMDWSPSRAARLTSTDWTIIREAIATAWHRLDAGGAGDLETLVVLPRALVDFGARETTTNKPLSETAGLFALDKGPLHTAKGAKSSIRIDVGAMADAFGKALEATGFASEEDFKRAMREFVEDATFARPGKKASSVKPETAGA